MRSILLAMMKSFSCDPLIFLVGRETVARPQPKLAIGVMAFALGKLADLLHEGKRFPEICGIEMCARCGGHHRAAPNQEPAPGSAGPHRAEAAEHRHDTACMFSRRDSRSCAL